VSDIDFTRLRTSELKALHDELIELRRKAAAYDRLFAPPAAPDWKAPPPYIYVQWKGTELCGDFHCECGASGHIDDGFAYSVLCEGGCGRVWELPVNLPLIVGRDEPHVVVHVDREAEA
jgi:hypothetical protein